MELKLLFPSHHLQSDFIPVDIYEGPTVYQTLGWEDTVYEHFHGLHLDCQIYFACYIVKKKWINE